VRALRRERVMDVDILPESANACIIDGVCPKVRWRCDAVVAYRWRIDSADARSIRTVKLPVQYPEMGLIEES
jgi:hypothetical protein